MDPADPIIRADPVNQTVPARLGRASQGGCRMVSVELPPSQLPIPPRAQQKGTEALPGHLPEQPGLHRAPKDAGCAKMFLASSHYGLKAHKTNGACPDPGSNKWE